MTADWIDDFKNTSDNALTVDWFISPLEYYWEDGRSLFDKMFRSPGTPHSAWDEHISLALFRMSMQVDFRAKMMVFAFMRQNIAKSYGLEIESGLISFYQLDYLSCLSKWIFVIEGYCRKLFLVQSRSNINISKWKIPLSGDVGQDKIIDAFSKALNKYVHGVMLTSTSNSSIDRLNRNLVLHGNAENKDIFSQKNCLILMFLLDALVVIEMMKNKAFPTVFSDLLGEAERVEQRRILYQAQLAYAFDPLNLLKVALLKQHT